MWFIVYGIFYLGFAVGYLTRGFGVSADNYLYNFSVAIFSLIVAIIVSFLYKRKHT